MRRACCHLLLLTIVAAALASAVRADDDCCCARCGHKCACQKVCRLVCEEKTVSITCWGCKAEDFAVPGPSHENCRHHEEVCGPLDPCGCDGVCAKSKSWGWTEWIPGCSAHAYTKTKLMRRIVVRKVPSYKWVVEDLCEQCEAKCGCADIQPGVEIPPPPATDAKLKYGAPKAPTPAGK